MACMLFIHPISFAGVGWTTTTKKKTNCWLLLSLMLMHVKLLVSIIWLILLRRTRRVLQMTIQMC
jgi:hypothetical protein